MLASWFALSREVGSRPVDRGLSSTFRRSRPQVLALRHCVRVAKGVERRRRAGEGQRSWVFSPHVFQEFPWTVGLFLQECSIESSKSRANGGHSVIWNSAERLFRPASGKVRPFISPSRTPHLSGPCSNLFPSQMYAVLPCILVFSYLLHNVPVCR